MNKYFIYEYISRIQKEDIINYSKRLGFCLNENDLDVIYYYIKNEYKRFFDSPKEIFLEVKGKVSDNTYLILNDLYNKYKDMIK